MSCISAQQFMTCLSAFPLLGCSLQLQANYTKKKSSHSGKGQASFLFFFEDERLVLSHNTVKTCSFLSSYYAPTLNYSNYLNQYSGK